MSKQACLHTLRAADAAYAAGDDVTALRLYADAAYQARRLGDLDAAARAAGGQRAAAGAAARAGRVAA